LNNPKMYPAGAKEAAEKLETWGEMSLEPPSGAKAHRLFSAACGTTEQAAEKRGTGGEFAEKLPSGAKARADSAPLTARLKPCPFKAMSFSATCEVVP
jgi:hypothetical protein